MGDAIATTGRSTVTSPRRLGFLSVSVGVLLMLRALSARADATTPECVAANTKGQELRRDHKLSAAREQLQRCAGLSCPEVVRDDCAKRLDELEHVQPTIVFDAKDAVGNDLSAVRVTVDGRVLTEKLEGTALLIDPGEHAFVFEAAGRVRVARTFVLKEGEKDRRERVVLDAAPRGAPAPPVAATPPSAAPSVLEPAHGRATTGSGQRVVGWIVMGPASWRWEWGVRWACRRSRRTTPPRPATARCVSSPRA